MTAAEAREALESGRPEVVRRPHFGAQRRGDIKYVTGPYVWVVYARTLIATATAPELLELEAA